MKIILKSDDFKKNYDKKIVRKFKDMQDSYKDSNNIKGNPIIYEVYIIMFDVFEAGLTVINSGNINKEYYMTKGHRHEHPTKEIYVLEKGKGKLMLRKGNITKVIDMKTGEIYVLPKNWGHRLINVGSKKLEVVTIYSKKAGRSYKFKFTKRLDKKENE